MRTTHVVTFYKAGKIVGQFKIYKRSEIHMQSLIENKKELLCSIRGCSQKTIKTVISELEVPKHKPLKVAA